MADTGKLLPAHYKNLNNFYFRHKSYCEDLTEGKFSFPIVHGIHSNPNDGQIIHILRQRTKDNEVKKYCVSLLEKFGSFEYTRQKLLKLREEAVVEVIKLGGNPVMDKVIENFFKMVDEENVS